MVRTVERFSIFLFFLASLQAVISTRFKINIPTLDRRSRRELDDLSSYTIACTNYTIVENTTNLDYPIGFDDLEKPWEVNNHTTLAKSFVVTDGIQTFLRMEVPGLNGIKAEEVLNVLQKEGCLSFPYGGLVRDQFLGKPPNDLDMETNCDNDTILEICGRYWGEKNCSRGGGQIVHIGMDIGDKEKIDVSEWNETFFGSGVALEYTTNSLAFFSGGLDIVIDITGHGINDTCYKKIRIPVGDDLRDNWAYFQNENNTKVYRYWKLRFKGYDAADASTKSYIFSEAIKNIEKDTSRFLKYYCKTFLKGKWKNSTTMCSIESDKCSNAVRYYNVFEEDLGNLDFWRKNVKSKVLEFVCDNCSSVLCGPSPTSSASPTSSTSSPSDDNNISNNAATFVSISTPFLMLLLSPLVVLITYVT